MVRPAKSFLTVLLLAGLCLASLPAAAAAQKPRPGRGKAAKPKVEAPAPAPVPAPAPTPGQLPPSPPQVSFRDGLLTVNAQNSTLADILAAVRTQTGASIDLPAGSGRERVFFRQGPAPARDVLTALLQGSHLDFIILGSQERPGDVQRVVLMVKPAGGDAGTAAVAAPPQPAAVPNVDPDLDEGDVAPGPDESQPQPYQQPFQPAPQPEPVQPAPNSQPKTPEQLLEELRQQQQRMQQQQQQQQQNPPPQPPETEPQ